MMSENEMKEAFTSEREAALRCSVGLEPIYDTVHPDYYVVEVRKPGADYSQSFWVHYEHNPRIEGWRIGGYLHVDSRHWTLDELIAGESGLKS